ncbi:hypothetical protein V6C66_13010 [Lacticaseibacillus paracasei]|uniref:hypothetical protein n=1 Tax=Lacticaseibacillus paracasei TaxID=1597 RepID=UPI002FDAF921
MDKIISIIIVILILLATIAFYLAPFVGGLWQGAARSKVIAKILLLNRDLKLSSKGLSRLINPQNPYIVLTTLDGRLGLKSIFETDFKRHSEPRLPSTAQINH